jgi:pyruvate carboxylase subunit B
MPNASQLVKVADPIIKMKCWDRIETNGGGFEQIQLLAGENPNEVVRKWTKPFNEVGIKTQMLERGLNALSMSPVSKDVRRLMFDVKSKQGTNISRSFDGLNDSRNLELSIKYANASGMISQSCLCITHSEIHSVEYYIGLAKKLIKLGTQEIAIKDMAGIGRPSSLGKIVKGIKNFSPSTIVQYHGHSGPGFSVASSLEVARAGADIIDVSMEPLSWGTTHADLLTIHELLRDDGFKVKDYDKKAYMEVKQLTQEFIDESLGYYINQKNRLMNSLLISSGLPGGMMGSLMSDLEKSHISINKWLKKNNS